MPAEEGFILVDGFVMQSVQDQIEEACASALSVPPRGIEPRLTA